MNEIVVGEVSLWHCHHVHASRGQLVSEHGSLRLRRWTSSDHRRARRSETLVTARALVVAISSVDEYRPCRRWQLVTGRVQSDATRRSGTSASSENIGRTPSDAGTTSCYQQKSERSGFTCDELEPIWAAAFAVAFAANDSSPALPEPFPLYLIILLSNCDDIHQQITWHSYAKFIE